MLSKTKVHYGWYICLASFLMMFCTYGLAVNVFSIFLPHIITETNLSKAEGSSIFTVQNVAILLAMLLAGKYYKKLGLRYGSSLAIFFIAIGYFIYANAHSLYAFYFGASLVGFGYGMGSMIPISILLNNWFNDKRAFALGLAASGSSFSALIMPTPLTILMETYNLYVTFFVQGILVLIISIILFIVIRDTPAECNLTPYQNGKSAKNNYVILDKKNDMHGGSYVMALIALFIFGGVSMGSFAHFAVHYSNLGYSNIIVSAAASVLGLILIGGKCLFGIITDRIGSLKSTYIFTAVWMFGFFLTANAGISVYVLFLCPIIIGLSGSLGSMGPTVWAQSLSSKKNLTRTISHFQIATMAGGIICTLLPGIIADYTGSYSLAFILFILMLAIVLVLIKHLYGKVEKANKN